MIPDPTSPEFASIRARLAVAYVEHKHELGVPVANDAEIVERVDEITALMLAASAKAISTGNRRWMARYRWFAAIIDDLTEDRPGKALDG
jgi:hypothetical protein